MIIFMYIICKKLLLKWLQINDVIIRFINFSNANYEEKSWEIKCFHFIVNAKIISMCFDSGAEYDLWMFFGQVSWDWWLRAGSDQQKLMRIDEF